MKKGIICVLLLAVLSLPAFAGRIVYTVDPATASPQPATVIASGNGEVKVIFNTSSIEAGQVYTFTLNMTAKGDNVTYPVSAGFKEKGNKKELAVAFEPAEVTFNDATTPVSTVVTLTVPEGDYSSEKKLKTKFKADAAKGAHLGQSAGVKVTIAKTASAAEFMQVITDELNEVELPEQVETN